MAEIRFPSSAVVRATGVVNRQVNAAWRTFGLYLDVAWAPTWPAEIVAWPDFGIPTCPAEAANAIQQAYDRALDGERVEIGCAGGLGRTGTVLACMAVLAGVPAHEAVSWVRANYDARAVETAEQAQWVVWFAANQPAPGGFRAQPNSSAADNPRDQ